MIRQAQEHFDASSNDLTRQSSIENITFGQSPVIYKATSLKQIQKLAASLSKQIQTSELNCLFILDLLSAIQRPQKQINVDPIKICYEIPLKKVFPDFKQQNLQQILKELKFEKIIRGELSEVNMIKQEGREKVKRPSVSLRIFPFHKSLKNFFMMGLPQVISPCSLFDILSYQKCQRICQVNYIFAYDDYEEYVSKKLETQIMLNWGQSQVKFYFPGKGSFELKPLETIVIPGGLSYKWVSKECLTKLLAWRILPKKSLPFIVQTLQPEVPMIQIPYPIYQILIDYTFHEFPHIQIQNEELMYTLANLLNREFSKQFIVIEKQLKMDETQILNGANEKKIDQCSKCSKFIINYFGFVRKDRKDSVYCVYCVKESLKINHVFQKMPKLTFQGGCELLTRIKSFKDQKIIQGQKNLQKLMKHIVFFQYEDICNGDFVGSYNSIHCKIHETDKKKVHNSHAKIIDNTITYLKSTLNVSSCADVIKQYSTVHYKNEAERKYFKEIMTKATYFMQESQQKELLSQLLPDYEEDSLKVFAIHLCAKDRI